ncbi:MAG TPA: cation:proton antiporter [Cellulomonas sp.]
MDLLTIVALGALAVLVVTALAPKLGVAAPLLLVALGVLVSLVPAVPAVEIEPEWILAGVLPPLLYATSVSMPTMDFRRDLTAISGLSVVLVVLTAVLLGVLFSWLIPDIGLATGIALGAIISPTDAVATSIVRRSGVSPRIVTVLEGESLLNDASALVLLRSAVAAAAASVSLWQVAGDFVFAVVVAVLVGALVGKVSLTVRSKLRDPHLTTAISFIVPFLAYLPAEGLGASGLVATVTAGLVSGSGSARLRPQDRIAEAANWRTLEVLLEGAVFLVMGLELYGLVVEVWEDHGSLTTALGLGALAALAALAVRTAYISMLLGTLARRARRGLSARGILTAIEQRADDLSSLTREDMAAMRLPGRPPSVAQIEAGPGGTAPGEVVAAEAGRAENGRAEVLPAGAGQAGAGVVEASADARSGSTVSADVRSEGVPPEVVLLDGAVAGSVPPVAVPGSAALDDTLWRDPVTGRRRGWLVRVVSGRRRRGVLRAHAARTERQRQDVSVAPALDQGQGVPGQGVPSQGLTGQGREATGRDASGRGGQGRSGPGDPETRMRQLRARITRRIADIDYLQAESFGPREGAVLVWAGMRGVVTLAAAQSLPADTPQRPLLVLIAFVVAAGTLLVQGGTLGWLVRRLGLGRGPADAHTEVERLLDQVALASAEALQSGALRRANGEPYPPEVVARARKVALRGREDADQVAAADQVDSADPAVQFRELRLAMIEAQRAELLRIRTLGTASSAALTSVLSALDADQISVELRAQS